MLTRAKAGVGFFRTVFYLPALAPPVAATLGFVYILNPATGPINTILGHLGITGPLWFNDPGWSKPSLVLLSSIARAAIITPRRSATAFARSSRTNVAFKKPFASSSTNIAAPPLDSSAGKRTASNSFSRSR